MKNACSYCLPALAATVPFARAWGTVGHATVAAVAENYLTQAGQDFVSNVLGNGVSMESIASWADSYRYTSAGRFSAPYQ